jgi:hypothetical protein
LIYNKGLLYRQAYFSSYGVFGLPAHAAHLNRHLPRRADVGADGLAIVTLGSFLRWFNKGPAVGGMLRKAPLVAGAAEQAASGCVEQVLLID